MVLIRTFRYIEYIFAQIWGKNGCFLRILAKCRQPPSHNSSTPPPPVMISEWSLIRFLLHEVADTHTIGFTVMVLCSNMFIIVVLLCQSTLCF